MMMETTSVMTPFQPVLILEFFQKYQGMKIKKKIMAISMPHHFLYHGFALGLRLPTNEKIFPFILFFVIWLHILRDNNAMNTLAHRITHPAY
ncbi:MAG: hypothetical protein LBU61_02490 [Coriobacteriales bacterium]|nr:hypothetical protein [Coriobacteriales bacterium]